MQPSQVISFRHLNPGQELLKHSRCQLIKSFLGLPIPLQTPRQSSHFPVVSLPPVDVLCSFDSLLSAVLLQVRGWFRTRPVISKKKPPGQLWKSSHKCIAQNKPSAPRGAIPGPLKTRKIQRHKKEEQCQPLYSELGSLPPTRHPFP